MAADIVAATRAEREAAFMARDYEPENVLALLSDMTDREMLDMMTARALQELRPFPELLEKFMRSMFG